MEIHVHPFRISAIAVGLCLPIRPFAFAFFRDFA